MDSSTPTSPAPAPTPRSWKKTLLITTAIVLACCTLTAGLTAWWVKHNYFASALAVTELNAAEREVFETKLSTLEGAAIEPETPAQAVDPSVEERRLTVTEREINAFLSDQGFGEQVRIDLKKDAMSTTFIIPVDPSVPALGGTTLRMKFAVGARMDESGQMVMQLDDVRVGGVPLPNAWLGDIKGVNLVTSELSADPGIQRFVAGIESFSIVDGSMEILLNE